MTSPSDPQEPIEAVEAAEPTCTCLDLATMARMGAEGREVPPCAVHRPHRVAAPALNSHRLAEALRDELGDAGSRSSANLAEELRDALIDLDTPRREPRKLTVTETAGPPQRQRDEHGDLVRDQFGRPVLAHPTDSYSITTIPGRNGQ